MVEHVPVHIGKVLVLYQLVPVHVKHVPEHERYAQVHVGTFTQL
jgi:hypothetical protein